MRVVSFFLVVLLHLILQIRTTYGLVRRVSLYDIDDHQERRLNREKWRTPTSDVETLEEDDVSISSTSIVETAGPIMISNNWEVELSFEIVKTEDESVEILLSCVKDSIRDADHRTDPESTPFEGLIVRLDSEGASVLSGGSGGTDDEKSEPRRVDRHETKNEGCKATLSRFLTEERLNVRITGGMGSLDVDVEADEAGRWVNCLTLEGSKATTSIWGYHYVALSIRSKTTTTNEGASDPRAVVHEFTVTSVEHDYAALDQAESDVDVDAMSEDEVRLYVVEMQRTHRRKLAELHDHLELQLNAMDGHIESMLADIRRHELAVERRVLALEKETFGRVVEFTEEHVGLRHRWFGPYLFIVAVVVGLAYLAREKYNYLIKQHLL